MTNPNALFTSKFVVLLKTFSVDELKSFERWLASPWCNSNKNLPKLLEKISKYYPDFDNLKYTKEKLFKQILPTGKYSDRRINNLLSEAFQSAEKFIIFQGLSNDQQLQTDLLTQELQNRHLEDWFFKESDQAIARLEAKPIKDWEDHLALLKLNRRVYHHPNQKPRMLPGSPTIVKMGEQLDLVFLLEKGAIINEKISRTRLLKDETHDVTSELAIWNQTAVGIHHPSIDLYKLRLNYEDARFVEQYHELFTAYFEKSVTLNIKEQKINLYGLINDSIRLFKRNLVDISKLLEIYKFGLANGALLENNELTKSTYQSIITVSNTVKDFDFSEDFIEKYTSSLNIDIKEDASAWAKGHTTYYKEELEESLKYLISYRFKSHFFDTQSRVLITMVYFDLLLKDSNYYDHLFNYFDAFEKWLNRDKVLSEYIVRGTILFVQKCRAIAKYYLNPDKSDDKIIATLTLDKSIQAREWLTRKTKEVIELKTKKHSK